MLRLPFVLAAACAVVSAQSQLVPLTTVARAHSDVRMAPNGGQVAFRVGTTSLGVVTVQSAAETLVHTSSTAGITSYVWDRFGQSLLFVEGDQLRVVARTGGTPLTLAQGLGTNVRIWCTDGNNAFLTRQNVAAGTTTVFRASTAGSGQPTDVVTYNGVADQLAIDRSGRFLLVRTTTGLPFSPAAYERIDLQAVATTPIVQLTDPAESGCWLDDGMTFVVAMRSPTFAQPQLARIDLAGAVTFLTDAPRLHRRPVAAPGGRWILFETQAPTGLGITVGLLPRDGGGVVYVDGGQPLYVNGGVAYGGLDVDGAELRLAICGSPSVGTPDPQIYIASLGDEVRVSPRLRTGASFTISLPLAPGEFGLVAASFGLGSPVALPPLQGQIWLDASPGNVATVLLGIGGGPPISRTYSLPANPALVGAALFFQGAHFDATLTGAFTRFGRYQVF